jgi:hypothetical protein
MEEQCVEVSIKELSKEIEEISKEKHGTIDIQEALVLFFELKKKLKK